MAGGERAVARLPSDTINDVAVVLGDVKEREAELAKLEVAHGHVLRNARNHRKANHSLNATIHAQELELRTLKVR